MLNYISDDFDKKLKELPFVEYLEIMLDRISRIRHRAKSDVAYHESMELSSHVISRYVSENNLSWDDLGDTIGGSDLRLSRKKLDLYNFKASDSRKSDTISDFVKEFTYDLQNIIRARKPKQNPNTTT